MPKSKKLRDLLVALDMTAHAFEKAIGVGVGTISKAMSRDSELSYKTIKKIVNYFPQVNEDWLFDRDKRITIHSAPGPYKEANDKQGPYNAHEIAFLGGGAIEMGKGGNEFSDLGNGQYLMIVPLVEEYAQAGYTSGFSDSSYVEDLPKHSIVVSQKHKGTYRAFRVSGDSMNNSSERAICDGDVAIGRMIDKVHWNSRFHLHKFTDYVIVHREGIIIKTIINHDVEAGEIVCHSKNVDKEKYPDFKISLSEVYEIFNVVSVDRPWK